MGPRKTPVIDGTACAPWNLITSGDRNQRWWNFSRKKNGWITSDLSGESWSPSWQFCDGDLLGMVKTDPFTQCLSDLQRLGIFVDKNHKPPFVRTKKSQPKTHRIYFETLRHGKREKMQACEVWLDAEARHPSMAGTSNYATNFVDLTNISATSPNIFGTFRGFLNRLVYLSSRIFVPS